MRNPRLFLIRSISAWHFASVCLCFSFSSVPWGTSAPLYGQDVATSNDHVLKNLGDIWEVQRNVLTSGEFHCRIIHKKVPEGHDLTRAEVRKLIGQLEEKQDSQTLLEVSASFDPSSKEIRRPWWIHTYLIDGESCRDDSVHLNSDNSVSRLTNIWHQEYQLATRPRGKAFSQQISIFPRGKLPIAKEMKPTDFVFIPTEKIIDSMKFDRISSSEKPANRLILSSERAECHVDEESGFVYELLLFKRNRELVKELIQAGFKDYGNGVVLPSIYFEGNYSGERLRFFKLRILDEVLPNISISPSTFRLPVHEGDIVVDGTRGEQRPFQGAIAEDAIDLLK